ncbi:hypothetical protein [Pseudalkalibacillus hwajinpoensis]|nr:hypothetical protein [Pseudalkalibacillus hwajinpoensis]MCA0990033.1 hypothetical protein [Pseudalkalibacillus hwajinpoensis]
MEHSREEIRKIEEKAKQDQLRAQKAKEVVKEAKKSVNPQREKNEFPAHP